MKLVWMFCFWFFAISNQVFPQSPSEATPPDIQIKGIVLASSIDSQLYENRECIRFVGLKDQKEIVQAIQKFIGAELNSETLKEIKNQIVLTYHTLHQPFMTVQIPEQEVGDGVVVFIVSQARVGEVTYRGNNWCSEKFCSKKIGLQSGDVIEENDLLDNVAWINRNPFHHSEVIFAPGQSVGLTDVEIYTKDRFPLSVYAGFDNTGTDVTGHNRLYVGCNWGNAFWVDDLLSYQFTGSDDFHKFQSNYLNYTSFLPWKDILIVYGAYSTIHPKITGFRHEGKYAQGSFRYEIPIRPLSTSLLSQVNVGADYKFLNSNLFFVDQADQAPILTKAVTIFQFVGSYQREDHFCFQDYILKLETIASFTPWFPHQNNHDYNDLRRHAKTYYALGRLVFGYSVGKPDTFSLATMTRGQVATGPLLSSEQFGLGGFDTVRGYDERVYVADNALCLNVEVRSPRIQFSERFENELIFLAFTDFGWGGNYRQSFGLQSNAYLWSIGPGIRWNFAPYLMTRLDYGFRLHQIQFQKEGLGRVHFSISARY